mmetsp:Transcript_20921/g.25380  ORF Transcript_20921/g.25380 Transcript_20921/m.25380 type:complete len:128 (+) Transcript_20921:755-1138(+)
MEYNAFGLADEVHAEKETFERDNRGCYSSSKPPAKPSFQSNTTQDCWFAPEGKENLPEGYTCQNPNCIKILSDPATEAAEALTRAQRFQVAGEGFKWIGLVWVALGSVISMLIRMKGNKGVNVTPMN